MLDLAVGPGDTFSAAAIVAAAFALAIVATSFSGRLKKTLLRLLSIQFRLLQTRTKYLFLVTLYTAVNGIIWGGPRVFKKTACRSE